jgi:hypothetical protein
MKKIAIISLAVIVGMMMSSCYKKDEGKKSGKVQFSVNGESKTNLKSATVGGQPAFILIDVKDADGNAVYFHKKIELINFNGYYLSQPVDLKTGSYKLTEFMVLDEANQVIYATPKTGSAKAYLVSNPLDISFTINEDEVTKLTPEVLSVDELTPADFGYLDASFELVKTFDFLISVFVYNDQVKNFELTSASLTVNNGTNDLYTLPLEAITNKVTVNDGYVTYNLKVTKGGYTPYTISLLADSLKACINKPLIVILKEGADEVDSGLVAYYPFNGNANDESGNGNNGIVHGATLTTDRFGNTNSAYYFDSTYISTGYYPKVNFSNCISISLWFKTTDPDMVKNGKHGAMLVSQAETTHSRAFYVHLTNDNIVGFCCLYYLFDESDKVYLLKTGFTNYYDNTWHHLVALYTGLTGLMSIYLDNRLIDSKNIGNINIQNTSYPINIGCYTSCRGFYRGSIDDIRIYNRVLSESEIQNLYNRE